MDDHDQLFHPESVNEQVEQLLRAQDGQQRDTTPGAATIAELRHIYQEDEALLERAWARIARAETAIKTSGNITNIVAMDHYRGKNSMHETDFSRETSGSMMHSAPISAHSPERPRQNKRARMWRAFSLIAAMLAAAVIVGSMLLVIGASRKHNTSTGNQTTKKHTQVTVLSSSAIYEGSVDELVRADAQTGKVVWSYRLPAKSDPYHMGAFMQILPAGKIVYARVGEADGPAMAFDAATGRVLWTSNLQNIHSMALVQGTLYVGVSGGPKDPNNSYVAELDANTGTQAGTQYTLAGNQPQISVVDGILYAGTDTILTAINPVHQQQLWQKSAADFGFNANLGGISGFTVDQGIVYATLQSGHSSYCLALNASSGDKQWQAGPIEVTAHGSGGGAGIEAPVAANGMVYFAVTGISGAVFAYKDDTQVWSYKTGALMVQQTPVLNGNTLYIVEDKISDNVNTAGQTTLVALNAAKGSVQWQKPPVSGISASAGASTGITVLNGVVYLATSNAPGNVDLTYAFEASTGAPLWQVSLGNNPYALAGEPAN